MRRFASLFLAVLISTAVHAQRLPRTILPNHYNLTFIPDIEHESFDGTADIDVSVQQPTTTVTLNAVDLDIRSASITSGDRDQTAKVAYDTENQTATLTVDQPLATGPATLHFKYSGKLSAQYKGLYIGSAAKKYVASQFESTDARRAFPSFDEPELKATFAISVVARNGDTAFSNGAIASDQPGPAAGTHTIRFRTTPTMSTYLVALLTGQFDCVSDNVEGTAIRVCAPPEKISQTKFALGATRDFLHYYNNYYGIHYPFEKLDQIALDLPGAMENSAAITYMDSYLLVDDATSSIDAKKSVATVVAHEIAHQWFGDFVTMRWWNDIWLNEGFATWMETKAVGKWKPEWNTAVDDVQNATQPFSTDVLASTRQIHADAETPADIDALFDSIAYGKTGAVLRMIESFTGEEAFRAGVHRYLSEHAWSTSTADDFANAIGAASSPDVANVLRTFVQNPGVPLVSVASRCDGNESVLTLTQRRFFVDPALLAKPSPELWTIPVCVRTSTDEKKCTMLATQSTELRVPGCGPVFANADGRGYYIAEHAATIDRTRLQPSERLALLRDEAYLERAGKRSAADLLALLEKLRTERDPTLAKYLLNVEEATARDAAFAGVGPQYTKWMTAQVRPLVTELGWCVANGEPDSQQSLRAAAIEQLARVARDPATLREARRLTDLSIGDPSKLHSSLWGAVWGSAASAGDKVLFDRLQKALEKSPAAEVRNALIAALIRFQDPALVRRAFELSFSPKMTRTDAAVMRFLLFLNVDLQPLVWNLFKENWARLEKDLPATLLAFAAGGTKFICDPALRDDVREFFGTHPVPGFERGLAQALESMNQCIATRDLQAESLRAWAKAAS